MIYMYVYNSGPQLYTNIYLLIYDNHFVKMLLLKIFVAKFWAGSLCSSKTFLYLHFRDVKKNIYIHPLFINNNLVIYFCMSFVQPNPINLISIVQGRWDIVWFHMKSYVSQLLDKLHHMGILSVGHYWLPVIH